MYAPMSNRNVTITLRFELECEAEGDPSYEIQYRWLRNGLPLEYTARIHWVKDAHRLVILDAIVSYFASPPPFRSSKKALGIANLINEF